MSGWRRTTAFVGLMTCVLYACTFTRDLDYLSKGEDGPGTSSGTSGDPGTSGAPGTSGMPGTSGAVGGDTGTIAGNVLVSAQANPTYLQQDGDHLYWSTDNGAVMRVAKAGGNAEQVFKLAVATQTIDGLAVDPSADGKLYFIVGGGVQAVPKAGGASTVFLPTTAGATSVVANETFVFVTHATGAADEDLSALSRYPKGNATQPTNLSPADETASQGITLTKDAVFWSATNGAGNLIVNQSLITAGGAPPAAVFQNIAKDSDNADIEINVDDGSELAADDTNLYWADNYTSVAYFLPRASTKGKALPLFTSKSAAAVALAIDAQFVYVTNSPANGPPQILRIAKAAPGTAEPFGAQNGPGDIVVDDKAIYYAYAGIGGVGANGGIQRVPK